MRLRPLSGPPCSNSSGRIVALIPALYCAEFSGLLGLIRILSPSPSESSTRICCDFFRIEFSSQMIDRNALSFAREGAWGIGIGTVDGLRPSQGLFNGHLLLRMNRMLVDASLQQVERIDRGVVLGPFFAKEARQDFFDGKDRPTSVFEVNGCAVSYTRLLNDSYRHSKHWTSPSPLHSRVTKKIIEQAQAELGLVTS